MHTQAPWKFSGEKLAEIRTEIGWTQAELAEAMGLPPEQQGNISRWESPRGPAPSTSNLKALVEALRQKLPALQMDDLMVEAMADPAPLPVTA